MKKFTLILANLFISSSIIFPSVSSYAITDTVENKIITSTEMEQVTNGDEILQKSNKGNVGVIDTQDTTLQESNLQKSDNLTEIEKQQINANVIANVNKKELVYDVVKKYKTQLNVSVRDSFLLSKEEYVQDYQNALNMDYLVPKTNSKFEIVLSNSKGSYSFVKSTDSYDEAINIANFINKGTTTAIPGVIDSNGLMVYSTNSMARFIKTKDGVVINNETIYVYPYSNLTGDYTYINHNSVDDAPIISENDTNVQVLVSGYKGWVRKNVDNKNYDIIVVPMNQVSNPSYYYAKNGQLYHFISTDVTAVNGTGNYIAVGVAPSFMQEAVKYYSYDGNYFYTSLDTAIYDYRNGNFNSAVNANNKFYNYYVYLPFRSKTSHTADEINSFINANTSNRPNSKLRGLGADLINSQEKYGVNAATILGVAINESAWGMSYYSQDRNNLFGIAAYDSNPDAAMRFDTVGACVEYFSNNKISKGYADPQDLYVYYGGFLGGKYLGANRKYASDPFWGEKAAAHVFNMDKYLSNNDLSKLSDYNYNQLAVYSAPTTVVKADNSPLYTVSQNIANYATFVGVPVVLTSLNTTRLNSRNVYEVIPARTSPLSPNGGPEFEGTYDWGVKGYIDSTAVSLINRAYEKGPSIVYNCHVQDIGWQGDRYNGEMAGTEGQFKRLEAIKIDLRGYGDVTIKYSTHVEGIGWQDWKSNGQISGTVGLGRRLEAIKIQAEGLPKNLQVEYRVHAQDIGWQDWKSNGQIAGTVGLGKRLEAIEIKVTERPNYLNYKSHVQDYGWQGDVSEGAISGTTGQAKRLEAIVIKASNLPTGATIRYKTHIQYQGWESDWKTSGQLSGTEGKARRLEAIQIQLVGAPTGYHIEYRTHIEGIGWESTWRRDGQVSGTTGQSKRLEAIQIRIVRD